MNHQPHVLREYAFVADGERGALIGPRGEVAWMCFPGWDGDPVFASLLGAPSTYAVSPVRPSVWGGHYEPGTLIWRSRWACGGSIVECREALAFPGDPRTAVLLRRIEAVRGDAQVSVALDAGTDWGRRRVDMRRGEDGVWAGRGDSVRMRWCGARAAHPDGDGRLSFEIGLAEGGHHDLVLEISAGELSHPLPRPAALWEATARAWAEQVPEPDTAAPRDACHAHAVLRGLTTRGGGMVACATTSLPERATDGRDYDYRYVWIRDQSYTGQAAAAAGAFTLLDDAVRFCTERVLCDGPRLRPVYRSDGGVVPDQCPVDLPGYPGAPEVHSGNAATGQFQLDTLGEALLLLATAAEHDRLDTEHRRAAEVARAAVAARWREPESGVWELEPREWTQSRLACVAGLRRGVAAGLADDLARAAWLDLAAAIEADTSKRCLHPSGRWQRAPDDERVDAALLVAAIRGAIPWDDPRSLRTLDAVRDELGREGYVYRFARPGVPLHEAEGAFLLCDFWAVLAELQRGRVVEAARRFERARSACGPPGLFSEEFDVEQRQMRGNLPQAFVHALLLESAARLRDAVEEPL